MKSFRNTIVLVIGGVFHKTLKENAFLENKLRKVKGIWVETEGMKRNLERMGFSSITVFPNPKSELKSCKPQKSIPQMPLRLVFFSRISKEKGVEDIISLVHKLNEENDIKYSLDFYGQIEPIFMETFDYFIKNTKYVNYCGVFDSTKDSVYKKLNEYDILLFPTHWWAEGVPGILVEAKMAGLAVIASDKSYNTEIIRVESQEGFIIKNDYAQEMLVIIKGCFEDRELLNTVKKHSYDSRKRYSLEEYEKLIVRL